MAASGAVEVELVAWAACSSELRAIRHEVFVREQNVPEALEDDGLDPECLHALARDAEGRAIGTGRLMPDGRIGRMAVLARYRGRGVGAALLEVLVGAAKARGAREVHLHAQAHAQAFYFRHGFRVEGEPYDEAGIPHVSMRARFDA